MHGAGGLHGAGGMHRARGMHRAGGDAWSQGDALVWELLLVSLRAQRVGAGPDLCLHSLEQYGEAEGNAHLNSRPSSSSVAVSSVTSRKSFMQRWPDSHLANN